jgi:predicted enzyme related to lactoylglutathione lyase
MEILAARVLVRPVDLALSLSFYQDVLELAVCREFPGGTVFFLGGGYLEVSGQATASKAIGAATSQQGSATEEQTAPGGSSSGTEPEGHDEQVRLWIQVRDLATTYRTLVERGAIVLRPPRREPWGSTRCGSRIRTVYTSASSKCHPNTHCAATFAADDTFGPETTRLTSLPRAPFVAPMRVLD